MSQENCTVTITLGDVSENHAGMQRIGTRRDCGFTIHELSILTAGFRNYGLTVDFVDLTGPIQQLTVSNDQLQPFKIEAGIMIVRNGVNFLLNGFSYNSDSLLREVLRFEPDKKAFMRGRIVNKLARHNLCFANFSQKSNIEEKKGTVIAFSETEVLRCLRSRLEQFCMAFPQCPDLTRKIVDLTGEGNYYYDISKCGIGYHGDSERRVVVGVRLGCEMPLVYRWYFNSGRIGNAMTFQLQHGDIYFMSDKAVGHDWKKRIIPTLRHAAGCEKYTE